MNSTLAEHGPLICDLQMQRAQQDIERNMLATMQSGLGAVGTDEMRSKQDEESVFLTPEGSPYSPNCAARYDIPVNFPEYSDIEQCTATRPLQASVPTSPYMTGSPEDAYMNVYNSSPPYSPPYDNSPLSVNGMVCSDSCSSPGSCSSGNLQFTADMCSPSAIPCTSANQFSQFLPQAPMPSIPTTNCNSLAPTFSTCCDQELKNVPCVNTLAYPQQHQGWPDIYYGLPSVNIEPSNDLPVETPIVVQDQQLTFYPPSPQPGAPMPGPMYPQNGNMFDHSYHPQIPYAEPPTPNKRTCTGKRPKSPKVRPPIQVDDSDIKDIPSSAQLWEFTLRVLKKPKYSNMVCWENQKEGLFRFHDAQAFAALWGKHRNRPNMTYDKVARALRYYYKRNIFKQVGGRLTYRFSERLSKLYQSED